jgi:carbon starvation protein CstA
MITFFVSIIALFAGYFFYSRIVEKIVGIDPARKTPALQQADGVDFVVMPWWKIFLIQFLNIAGLGPIFGAVAGAMWGPAAFLWIVLGSIFAGGVHDYCSGMLSVRHNGKSIAEISGHYLGNGIKQFMRAFTVILMIIVGAVFILGPARILAGMTEGYVGIGIWTSIILVYYILSTILPIDKVIGRLYPFFGFALIFMALGITVAIFTQRIVIPELTVSSLSNLHYSPERFPLFPMLFITIACGAVSGFHATQSPIMSRCLSNEKQGRSIFYGAMITEGLVALIWAAIGMSFYGSVGELNQEMLRNHENAAIVVSEISTSLLGKVGGFLVLLGVVAAPITSGDTSFRSARIIIADFMNVNQKPISNRLFISIPLFIVGFLLTQVNFGVIWRYFAWTNQTLATIVLWTITAYLMHEKKNYWIALIPSVFMTVVVTAYILIAPEGFSLPHGFSITIGISVALTLLLAALVKVYRKKEIALNVNE